MSYMVYANGIMVAQGDGAFAGFVHEGLSPNTEYTYVVWAVDTSGNATPSASVTATTLASVVGAWSYGTPSTTYPMALTFYDNGFYIHYSENCIAGVEYGTYVYDPLAETITFYIVADMNGECGMSADNGVALPGVLEGDTFTVSYTDGDVASLKRVDGGSGSIVGGWDPGEYSASLATPLVLTFYDNGFYIHYQTSASGCVTGVEYGTYTFDAMTDTLTANAIRDDNSDCGLVGGEAGFISFAVTGDVITVIDDIETELLYRVK